MSEGPVLLEIEGISVRFGEEAALRSVSLRVRQGQVVALAGPNGSGKSTLLRVIAGLQRADEGTVLIAGKDGRYSTVGERARCISWMPQEEPEGDDIPVEEYVRYARNPHLGGLLPRADPDPEAVDRALDLTGTGVFRHRRIRSLSGGERQRVRMARILAQEAPVILLDEPTSHLDIGHQLELLGQVRAWVRRPGRLVVLALHDLNLAARFADRIVVLSHGHRAADGSPSQVLSPSLLFQVWGIEAELRRDAKDNVPYLIPRLPEQVAPRPPGGGRRVHVVAGGGSGQEILRRLFDAGFDLTAGALPLFDSDSDLAAQLGILSVLEVPFAPLSPATLDRVGPLLDQSEAVVIAAFPVGPANVGNLEAVARLDGRRPVFPLTHREGTKWDYTEGPGALCRATILARGGTEVEDTEALLRSLKGSIGPQGSIGGPRSSPGVPGPSGS